MTNFNHYTIAALPDMKWDSELPGTVFDFLEEFKVQLEPLRDGISDILLLNDVKNLELILKSRLDCPEEFLGNRDDGVIDFYKAWPPGPTPAAGPPRDEDSDRSAR